MALTKQKNVKLPSGLRFSERETKRATNLNVGETICEGRNKRIEVKEITLCPSDRNSIHINNEGCYWEHALVEVLVVKENDNG